MKAFLTPLQGLAEFEQIKEKSKTNKGILQVSGCMESQKSHLMYGLSGIAPYRLILALPVCGQSRTAPSTPTSSPLLCCWSASERGRTPRQRNL